MEYKAEQPQKQRETSRTPRLERREAWKTQELGEIKLNVSSLCEGNEKGAGLGIVARVTLKVYCRPTP